MTEEVVRIDGVTVGVENEHQLDRISVYPNPVKDVLTISNANYSGIANVQIFDALGRIVYNGNHSESKIYLDLSGMNINTGIFEVMVTLDNATYIETIIVK